MAIITLTSDYGLNSPYVASLKGRLYGLMPAAVIVDVSHSVRPHDTLQAAYLIRKCSTDFPTGTIHILAVDTSYEKHKSYLVVVNKGSYFIGADNGVFSLLFDDEPDTVALINHELIEPNHLFPEKYLFTSIAVRIASGESLSAFSKSGVIMNVKQNIAPVVEGNLIRGNIIFIDGYGNAITNISKSLFDKKNENKKKFSILYRKRQGIHYISKNYHDVKSGNELAIFNESGLLEIAMNTGKADQLLGLLEGSQIIIEFND